MLDRAENLLHDHYGGREYWDVSTSQWPLRVFSSENLTISSNFQSCWLKPWAVPDGLSPPHRERSAFTAGYGVTQGQGQP